VSKDIKKILVIRFSSLGDVLLATPLIRLLRLKYPKSQIDFLVREEYADLVRYNSNISQVIEFDIKQGFSALRKLRKNISDQMYDVIFDIHRSIRSRYLTFLLRWNPLSGTKVYRVRKKQFIRFLIVKFKINLYRKFYGRIIPVWEKYVLTARPIGVTADDGQLELYLSNNSEPLLKKNLKKLLSEDYVLIAPGAKHFTKRWPAEYFNQFIMENYRKYNLPAILVGDASDIPVVEEILSKLPLGIATSLAGELSILQTAEVIRQAKLVISNDSGLMHVAAAFQKPLIAIFGSTVEELGFFPNSTGAMVVENKGLYCRPCTHIGRASCPEKHFRCMLEITPKAVMEKITLLLK
jgi:lipopolysaccharide heptosyltransferase II